MNGRQGSYLDVDGDGRGHCRGDHQGQNGEDGRLGRDGNIVELWKREKILVSMVKDKDCDI